MAETNWLPEVPARTPGLAGRVEAEDARRQAEVVAELARSINAALDLDTILEQVTDAAKELCRCDLSTIRLRDADAPIYRSVTGIRYQDYAPAAIEPGKGGGGIVLLTGRPFRTANYSEDPRITKDYLANVTRNRIVAQLVVPIQSEIGIEGLLYAENQSSRPFTDQDETTLERLAAHAAIAIRNTRLLAAEKAARARAEASERALRLSEERYRILFERNLAGVLWARPDGTILDCNDALARLLGYEAHADLIGLDMAPFYVDRAERDAVHVALQQEGVINGREVCWRRRDGTYLWLQANIFRLEDGVLAGVLLDITDARRAAEAEQQASALRAIATLANTAAHEINNPLTVLMGRLHLLQHDGVIEPDRVEPMQRAAQRIREIVARMARITHVELYDHTSPDLPPMLDLWKSAEPSRKAAEPGRVEEST